MNKRPNYFLSLLQMKCPRCRKGHMFRTRNPFHWKFSHIFDMHDNCPVCGQKFELETGFWFGTGYVSYALAVALSVFNLIWFWVIFGITWKDNSIMTWLIVNGAILLLVQPWLMRISRVIYLYFFVYFDDETINLPEEK
ncbi:DUF983 domain-containing protein [Chitinophaga sedimenti]|uniref:DUF983 domain-containing protein n=1 Tax=Chitinophaga sedimenti TaxID=2033606 RepID=UPI0020031E87|nr:DUF983 domain-containing protein [Chitinophaga sedimenti]MCK7557673.1 DUF983 domain-containing protein [Chitinophaga sedimenti]